MSTELIPKASFGKSDQEETCAVRLAYWRAMKRHLGVDLGSPGGDMSALIAVQGRRVVGSWIERDAAKVDPRLKVAREVAAHRRDVMFAEAMEDHLRPPGAPSRRTSKQPRPRPPPDKLAELRRLERGPQHWTCSIRAELLAEGLVEITTREDGRWGGDQLTAKGRALLKQDAA